MAALLLAMLLTVVLLPFLPFTRLGFLYMAVAAAAALSGPLVVAAVIVAALVFVEVRVVDPGSTALTAERVMRGLVFIAISSALALLVMRLRLARERAAEGEREARRLAEDLTEQAAELELQVTETEALAEELERVNAELAARSGDAAEAVRRAERLHHLTTRLLNRSGERGVASLIVEAGREAVGAHAAGVARLAKHGIEVMEASGYDTAVLARADEIYEAGSPLREALEAGQPVWIGDRAELQSRYPDFYRHVEAGPHRAWAVLPLQVEQRRLGALGLSFAEPQTFSADTRSFMLLLAQQCAQALERGRLYDMERRARVRAEFAERRLGFLADASDRLNASLDYREALAALARQAVPEFADWCTVHLLSAEGVPKLIAAVDDHDARLARRMQLEQSHPPSTGAATGVGRVLRTGELEHIRDVDDVASAGVAYDASHLAQLTSLAVREQLTVPVLSEQGVVGALTFAISESSRTFDDADVKLAQELGRRAGQTVENARLYQAAHRASEAKSNFLAVMSHELRTPLNAIIGYSDLLLMGVPDGITEQAERQVQRIRVAAGTLLHLVEEVLSFSRIEAGKEEVRISPVDLNALVRDCVAMVEPLAAEKDVELRLELPAEPVKIVSDERKIRQIVTNLLSNAVKFTERGSIEAGVSGAGDGTVIVIRDTGIGIPAEHLERIFDPFWQVEPASTRRFGGTGLGLGVARRLAVLLGGSLEVESEEGVGSAFSLRLPVRLPPAGTRAA